MWITHPDGFFSVVAKPGDSHLTVRARVASDLDALRERWCPELGSTRAHEGTDYPYRASVDASAFGQALAAMGSGIDYSNFKNEVSAAKAAHERARTPRSGRRCMGWKGR